MFSIDVDVEVTRAVDFDGEVNPAVSQDAEVMVAVQSSPAALSEVGAGPGGDARALDLVTGPAGLSLQCDRETVELTGALAVAWWHSGPEVDAGANPAAVGVRLDVDVTFDPATARRRPVDTFNQCARIVEAV